MEENMSYQEKRSLASIVSTILVFGAYFTAMLWMVRAGRFEGPDAASLIGLSILILIACAIAFNIVITILFSIVFAITEGDPHPSYVVDERDKLIELNGLRISAYLVGAGFILSMTALALGQPVFLVFNFIVSSFAFAEVISNIVKLRMYRKGF
jgi:hypothetical protein